MSNFDGTGSRGTGQLDKGLGPCSGRRNQEESVEIKKTRLGRRVIPLLESVAVL